MIKFRLKQEGPHIEDLELIKQVSQHPFLYDTRSTDYRNLPLRATVWASIANNLNIQDPNVVQKRWKVLREKFSLSYRKEVLEEVQPNWPLFDSLTFLEPFVKLKQDPKKYRADESTSSNSSKTTTSFIEKSPLDEQVLIQLVRERPSLYDKRHEDFRVPGLRRKAWEEISALVGWDIDTLQKRWRVMRDRFVRELRKSRNVEPDMQLNCSTFFREMLFLTVHVRSKKYEVEAHLDDSEVEYEYEEYDSKVFEKNEKSEDQDAIEITEQNFSQYIQNADESDGRYENEAVLEEHIDQDDEYIEEVIECSQNEMDSVEEVTEILSLEELSKDPWTKSENVTENKPIIKKRKISIQEEMRPTKTVRPAETSKCSVMNSAATSDSDEDITFGNSIGLMLKRIPQHLKTAVKLKLLQSLADFEAEHKI